MAADSQAQNTPNPRDTPSDQALEALLADTRAILSERSEYEADRVNRDLDVLLHRVRGSKRGSRASALHLRNQHAAATSPPESAPIAERSAESVSPSATSSSPAVDSVPAAVRAAEKTQPSIPQKSSPTVSGATSTVTLSAGSVHHPTLSFSAPELLALGLHPGALDPAQSPDVKPLHSEAPLAGKTEIALAELAQAMPLSAQPQAGNSFQPGLHLILSNPHTAAAAVSVAEHLALRAPGAAEVILGGAKTITPGSHTRARGGKELAPLLEKSAQTALYLVLVNSPVKAHQNLFEKICQLVTPLHTWAVVDALTADQQAVERLELPPEIRQQIDGLAITNLWESEYPLWFYTALAEQPAQVLLELAPASPELWQLIIKDCWERKQGKSAGESALLSTGKEA